MAAHWKINARYVKLSAVQTFKGMEGKFSYLVDHFKAYLT